MGANGGELFVEWEQDAFRQKTPAMEADIAGTDLFGFFRQEIL